MATNDNEALQLSLSENAVCSLCVREPSKYTCPRCNVRYCSLGCYRGEKHVECSEAFYKNCVMDELKEIRASPEERQQILEMLARTEADTGDVQSDDSEEDDLEDRIAGLNLDTDTDEIFRRLSDTEKREFHTMVRDGRLANLVEVWTPWWYLKNSKLVSEVGEESASTSIPSILQPITDIHVLVKNKKVSSDVRFNLVNALFAYAYVSRLHNGEHLELAVESAEDMLSISDVLSSTQNCTSAGDAVHMVLAAVQKFQKEKEREKFQPFAISVIEDVNKIIQGSESEPLSYTMSAVSDIIRVLTSANQQLSKGFKERKKEGRESNMKDFKRKLFLAKKKSSFFLSWCQRFGMSLLELVVELELEFCSLSSELAEVTETKNKFEEVWGGTKPPIKPVKLIEEIR